MAEGTLESELKFRARTDAPLRRLAQVPALGPASLGALVEVDEMDRYLDTADGRLAAAGWACRMRDRAGTTIVSLKGPPQQQPGSVLHLRPEVEGPATSSTAPGAWPASPARALLERLSGGAPLIERLTMRQRRLERPVTLAATPAGTLSIDTARVLAAGTERGILRVVELELDPAALAGGLDPVPLAAALSTIDGLEPEPQSKLELALEILGVS